MTQEEQIRLYRLMEKLNWFFHQEMHLSLIHISFFVGGALGVDMWAGEQLLTLRAQTGYEDIKIIVVVPFIGYDSKWPALFHRYG